MIRVTRVLFLTLMVLLAAGCVQPDAACKSLREGTFAMIDDRTEVLITGVGLRTAYVSARGHAHEFSVACWRVKPVQPPGVE